MLTAKNAEPTRRGPRHRRRRLPGEAVQLCGAAGATAGTRPTRWHRSPACSQVGDLSLDPAAHRCPVVSETIEVTPRQFALLELLMRRPVRCFPNARSSTILGLRLRGRPEHRRGLRPPAPAADRPPVRRHTLRTVRGAGYRLDPEGG